MTEVSSGVAFVISVAVTPGSRFAIATKDRSGAALVLSARKRPPAGAGSRIELALLAQVDAAAPSG
jgi:hypothetical protein